MKKIMLFVIVTCFTLGSFAQSTPCGFQYGKTEADSLNCLQEVSLFRTFYDQKNYQDAYPHWKQIVETCPCSWNAIFNTTYLQNMFDALIKSAEDNEELKNQYIDDLLNSVGNRHLYFPKNFTEGNGIGFKAFYMIKYKNKTTEDILNAFNLFIESIEMEKEKTQPNIWDIYFNVAEQIARAKKDTTIMIDAYERATEYIETSINNYYKEIDKQILNFENLEQALEAGKITPTDYENKKLKLIQDTARSMQFITNYQKTLKNIENKFTPFAPCGVLEQVYSNKFEQIKDDLTKLKKMLITLNKGGCTTSQIFADMLNIVHKAEPSAQTANLMGYYSLNIEDYDKALEFFREAVELFETNEQKVDPLYMIGLINQLKGNYQEARNAALQVLKIKPNSGKAYILIGDLYAASGIKCTNEDTLPFDYNWAAADKYSRAAAVDPSVADLARAKRTQLRMPTEQERFQRGYTTIGAEYKVGCWIQETTTVRN
ncbi:MAG: tetratricopeptide repeat protein [Bacteroidetes bacterium]|nr:tetratricopeptide repeat protein [Bacteroidota bacterium]MCL1968808.1 tetratricopeptide repeat protein [Bacteroidota bacterium]